MRLKRLIICFIAQMMFPKAPLPDPTVASSLLTWTFVGDFGNTPCESRFDYSPSGGVIAGRSAIVERNAWRKVSISRISRSDPLSSRQTVKKIEAPGVWIRR